MPTQLADVIQPDAFTAYQVQNSMVSTALYQSGVAVPNGEIEAQLSAGAEFFTVPDFAGSAKAVVIIARQQTLRR